MISKEFKRLTLMRLSLAVLCVLVAAILTAAFLPVTAGAERQSQPGTAAPKTAEEHGMGWKRTPPGQYEQYVIDTTDRQFKASVDLSSQMPPVGDQDGLSSCVAWSTGYYYKSWQEKQEHTTWDLTQAEYQASPAFVYNLGNGGDDEGMNFDEAFDVLQRKGSVDMAEFPFVDGDYTTQPTAAQKQAALPYRIAGNWSYIFYQPDWPPYNGAYSNDLAPLKAQLDSGEPFVMGFDVYGDFPDSGPGSPDENPYYDYDGTSESTGLHAMCVVGYDDNANPTGGDDDHKGGFLAVNSWGADWNGASAGYVYFSYDFMKHYAMEAWQMDDSTTPDTPHINSITPDTGGPGTSVRIDGYNFGTDRRASKVTINGTEAVVNSWTNAQITVTVPDPVISGPLVVYDWEGNASNSAAFHGAPVLTSLDKSEGVTGETVTLTGSQFGTSRGTSYVSFGSARADTYTQWTETTITCEVPPSAGGLVDVVVTTAGGTSGSLPFSVVPTLDALGPPEGAPGTEVTLYGTGFGIERGSSTVMFDGVPATGYNLWSENEIKCLAPETDPGTRAVSVHTTGGESSAIPFLMSRPAVIWYLAEGSTDGGMETWVLVQNPQGETVTVSLTLMTDTGEQSPATLQDVAIAGNSRMTFNLNSYVTTFNVSTRVEASDNVVCERAMYGNNRAWAHESVGVTATSSTWFLAEGCTDGGMETWVLVQNPNVFDVTVTLELQDVASGGAVIADVLIAAGSRRSFNLGDSLTTYSVSTMVASRGGNVVCERAMYGNGRAWAHDSAGARTASDTWYLAEGCTDGGFETWVLVQNPGTVPVEVDLELQTDQGSQTPAGLQGVTIAPRTRQSFSLGDYVTTYNVSTRVTSTGGGVVCERAMYGNDRAWAHESVGASAPASTWLMAEGCTAGGMETWVLVQNPNATEVTATFTLMTDQGPVYPPGLTGVTIDGNSRRSFNLGFYAATYNVSTMVVTTGGDVVCERAMYGNNRTWAHDSVGYAP